MTPVEQLEAVTAEVETLKAQLAAAPDVSLLAAITVERDEMKAALETANTSVVSLSSEVTSARETIAKLTADLETANADNARLSEAMKLKPSAFAAITDGGAPVSDSGPAADTKSPATCRAEYNKLSDPAAREEYRQRYAVELGLKKKT